MGCGAYPGSTVGSVGKEKRSTPHFPAAAPALTPLRVPGPLFLYFLVLFGNRTKQTFSWNLGRFGRPDLTVPCRTQAQKSPKRNRNSSFRGHDGNLLVLAEARNPRSACLQVTSAQNWAENAAGTANCWIFVISALGGPKDFSQGPVDRILTAESLPVPRDVPRGDQTNRGSYLKKVAQ